MALDADALPLTTPVNVFIELALMRPELPLAKAPLDTLAYLVTDTDELEDLGSKPYLLAEKAFVLCNCIFFEKLKLIFKNYLLKNTDLFLI